MSESRDEMEVGLIDIKVQANNIVDSVLQFYHIHELDKYDGVTFSVDEIIKHMEKVSNHLNIILD
jgi:hypothetical protein